VEEQVDRRRFIGSLTATATVVGAGTFATEESRLRGLSKNGRAVAYRPAPGPTATTLLWRVDTVEPVAALTFDDGPDPRYTAAILDVLDRYGALATFFMQGDHVEAHPELAQRVAERHAVGNHTYSHPDLGNASAELAGDEIQRAQDAIERVVGETPVLFRPPYGRFSGATSMMAARLGYDIVLWSDRLDSEADAATNVSRLAESMQVGDILLGHDGGSLPNDTVAEAVAGLLQHFQDQGITTVTVPQLMRVAQIEQTTGSGGGELEPPELAAG
jgi:peptidoglycan/xylan/chitin deacetylase (PgdA/CDA1 family)